MVRLSMAAPDDDQDFDAFYQASRPACLRATMVTVRDLGLATEFVDEAFARAYERWDRVRDHPNRAGWIVRTAVNLSRKRWHRGQREQRRFDAVGTVPPPDEPTDASLLDAILELPLRQREVVAYRVVLGASAADTADALGISASTVGVHLHRAMASLREDPRVVDLAARGM